MEFSAFVLADVIVYTSGTQPPRSVDLDEPWGVSSDFWDGTIAWSSTG